MYALDTVRQVLRPLSGLNLNRALRQHRRILLGGGSVTGFLVAWEIIGSQGIVRPDLISYPTEVLAVGIAMARSGELWRHSLVTLQELAYGFVPALIVGLGLGLIMAQSRRLCYLLDPLIMAFYTAPRIALIPVLVIWFGVGMESKVAVVFLGGIFPILVNTIAGIQQIDPLWIRAVRAFGANTLDIVTKVLLPGALPAIMAGIRLGLGRAIISVIAGEMYVSVVGIGRLVQVYSSAAHTTEIIVLVVVIATFGVLCVTAIRQLEERLCPWRQELEF